MTKIGPRPGKYLIFRVGAERYAIALSEVREVIAMTGMTKLPSVHESLEGVFNLRGKILSVADLRHRLGQNDTESKRPCIIAVDVNGFEVANIVDDVIEVCTFKAEHLDGSISDYSFEGVFKDFILGVAKTRVPKQGNEDGKEIDQLTILLDIDRLLNLNLQAKAS